MPIRRIVIPFLFVPLALLAQAKNKAGSPASPIPSANAAAQSTEAEANALKEDVFKAKTLLREVEEEVLRGKLTSSKGVVNFENKADNIFVLENAKFFLDDKLVYEVAENPKKAINEFRVFDESLPPGDHKLRTEVRYHGSAKALQTMFQYFKDHKFELTATETFPVEYGKTTVAKIRVLDKGYFNTDFKERLILDVKVLQDWGVDAPE